MEFEWDEAKAASNLKKHGIPFSYATAAFYDVARFERPDLDGDFGEERLLTIGLVEDREITVISTFRSLKIRLISARKATKNERAEYWENRQLHL